MGYKKPIIYLLVILGVLGGLSAGFVMLSDSFTQGTGVPGEQDQTNTEPTGDEEMDGPWLDRQVKKNIELQSKQNEDITSGTIRIFKEKPTDSSGNVVWDNPRTIESYFGSSEEIATINVDSETSTFQNEPGTYYVVVESDGRYMNFGEITLPDGSSYEETLSEYNAAPQSVTYELADRFSPTAETVDLGVNSNTTSVEEWSGDTTIRPSDGSEYRVWKLVAHTGDVDMTTDSDSDGNHDEGIQKAYFELSGTTSSSFTVFNPNNGIDRLGSDDKAELDLEGQEVVVTEDSPLTVTPGVVTFETDTGTAADGDEVLTDGENPFDFQLFDVSGTGTSMFDVTA
jgi:hypothetical protein